MQITQSLHRCVQIGRDRVATTFGERRRTWGELAERAARLGAGLSDLGIGRGDRIAIIGQNSDRYLEIYYAAAWIGAVVVPGNTRWSEAEHLYSFEDSTPSLLFIDQVFAHLAAPLTRGRPIPVIYVADGSPPEGMLDYESLIANHAPVPDQCGRDDDLYGIFYTGGTTGHPKGVMLSHRSLVMNALYGNATLTRYGPEFATLHSAPLFHMAAFGTFLANTMAGGSHVIIPGFDPALVVDAFVNKGANSALFVPTMFAMLGDYLQNHPADLSGVRAIAYGASPISQTLLAKAMEIFPNAEFSQGYGQSELGPVATTLAPEDHKAKDGSPTRLRSAGKAYIGVDVKIADEGLQEVPRGQIGEIVVRHDGIMLGYWNKPDQTANTIVDGWVRTGDAGYMDEDGYVFVVDRVKDMIISGGENVFSAEVENVLAQHAAVAECVVIGVPDDRWGERVHAIVRLRDGYQPTSDELIAHCRTLIAGYKSPRSVEIRIEPFPLSAAGKVLKRDLRLPYWADQ